MRILNLSVLHNKIYSCTVCMYWNFSPLMMMMMMPGASGVTTCSDSLWPQALCSLSPLRVVQQPGDIFIIVTIVTSGDSHVVIIAIIINALKQLQALCSLSLH